MENFWAEFIGTMILIVLGDGVVANVVLEKTKGAQSGWIVITTGWGLAVAIAVYSVGHVSGAHINPAVTLGLASIGQFAWDQVPVYLAAQLLGAFAGGVVVWAGYHPHWSHTQDPNAKLGVFATAPEVRAPVANFITEVVGTAILVFGVLAIAVNTTVIGTTGDIDLSHVFATGINPLLVGFLVWAIGLSWGGPTGYAINPARDLGPRIAHAVLPIPGKGSSDWGYAWIPVVAPIVGGVLGAVLFKISGLGIG